MTYAELLTILRDAERRVRDCAGTPVAVRSQETVDLIHERLRRDGLTVADLIRDARAASRLRRRGAS